MHLWIGLEIYEIKFNQIKAITSDNYLRKSAARDTETNNPSTSTISANKHILNSNNHHPNPQKQSGNRAKNLLKFENDYDFEQANSKFEELRSQLSKLKVGDEAKPEQVSFFVLLFFSFATTDRNPRFMTTHLYEYQ